MNQSACPYDPCHLAEADVRFQTGQVGGSEGGEGRQLPETADRTVKPPVLCYVTCLIEIVVEILVFFRCALCCLYHYKPYGTLFYHSVVAQFLPVYLTLIVADVDAMNLISLWIGDVSIEGTPAETERRNKEIVEEKDVE